MLHARDFLRDTCAVRSDRAPDRPSVSIVLAVESQADADRVRRTVDSVLRQSESDFELVLVEDAPAASVRELIDEFRSFDSRVVTIRHAVASDIVALRLNEGIEAARGKWIACLKVGDVWHPSALARLLDTARIAPPGSVILGRATADAVTGPREFPDEGLTSRMLCVANRMILGCAMLPRDVFDRVGLFDCSIPMRRLFEWDFWLRTVHVLPTYGMADIIIHAAEPPPGGIGRTSADDLAWFRVLHTLRGRDRLTPARWLDFALDSLTVGGSPLPDPLARRLYARDIVPYYLDHRHSLPQIEGFPAQLGDRHPKLVGLVRPLLDCLDHISFLNFDEVAASRGSFQMYFSRAEELRSRREAVAGVAGWLLNRVSGPGDESIVRTAIDAGQPVGYYLDDDLFQIHLDGDGFSALRPGEPEFESMRRIVTEVDAVWVINDFIGNSVKPHNPRTIPHIGCVQSSLLPDHTPHRDPAARVRIGYVGSGCRMDEFQFLWEAFQRIAGEFGGRIEIEFWGPDMAGLPPLPCPWKHVPFTHNYLEYLDRLRRNRFDILLCPLFANTPARLAKGPIKYYEFAIAGALGIFSDVPPYAGMPNGETCLKARNTVDDWHRVLREAITMPVDQFDHLRSACIAHVRETCTPAALLPVYEAAWRATEFHARTRSQRHVDGRPRVAFVRQAPEPLFAITTEPLADFASILRRYSIEPVLLDAGPDLSQRLADLRPSLIHSDGSDPTVAEVCARLAVPHVISVADNASIGDEIAVPRHVFAGRDLVHVDSGAAASVVASRADVATFCSRGVVPVDAFDVGRRRLAKRDAASSSTGSGKSVHIAMVGPLRASGGQLEALAAVGTLRRTGLDVRLRLFGAGSAGASVEYADACRRQIERDGTRGCVTLVASLPGVAEIFTDADLLLHLDPAGTIPKPIQHAMAAAVLVVTPPRPGLAELLGDGTTSIACAGSSIESLVASVRRVGSLSDDERRRIVVQARRVALAEFHPHRISNDLFSMYLRAIDVGGSQQTKRQTTGIAGPHFRPTRSAGERAEEDAQSTLLTLRIVETAQMNSGGCDGT
jgi:glycosyltransferase involved in cell wall biosynthesis